MLFRVFWAVLNYGANSMSCSVWEFLIGSCEVGWNVTKGSLGVPCTLKLP